MNEWKNKALELANTTTLSWRKIAKKLGVPKSTCSDYLRKAVRVGKVPPKEGAKILVLDIETKYMLMGGWGLFNQNFSLSQIEEDWTILSYSAKWYGEDEVLYEDISNQTEDNLLSQLWDLLNQADFCLAHNGRRFDLKKIRARMVARGFKPYSPVRVLDTLEIAKKEFAFTSNKLEYLTKLLCKKHQKSSHEKFHGYLLWKEFVKGNPEAIQEMRDYNIINVTSLEELYNILAPWSSSLPNFDIYLDSIDNSDWVEDGFHYSNLGKYQRYRNIKTGQYKRGRKNLLTKEYRQDILSNIVGAK